jgi:acetyl esterase/lipase
MPLTPPPFDPELAPALPEIHAAMAPAVTPDMLPRLRAVMAAASPPLADLAGDGAFAVSTHAAPGPAGAPDVELLVVRPAQPTGPLTVLYHLHGGGMVMGDNRFGVAGLLPWAAELGLVVVSAEYRLAPEHPYPAGIEDAYAGLTWVTEHAAELGAAPDRVLLAGASSGAGMTAALALLARDRGAVHPLGQLLMYPMLDDRNDRPSTTQMAGLGVWDRTANDTGWTALLGAARGTDAVPPYAAPSRATDLAGLPPAFLEVGTAETFRDEVVDYATRLAQAGGEVELHVWPGAFHAFDFWVPTARISQDAAAARVRWLRRVLEDHTRSGMEHEPLHRA